MKKLKINFICAIALMLSLFQAVMAAGQCTGTPIKLLHTSGTQSYGCIDVTVTPQGFASTNTQAPCFYSPYRLGFQDLSGSYTFTFSAPVAEVKVDMQFIDNQPGLGIEEMVFEVNGSFYPLTSPGTPDGCYAPAILWPPGVLRGPLGGTGSAKDIIITGAINSVKISNIVVEDAPNGIAFDIYLCCLDCDTDAGTINANDFEACIGEPAEVAPATQVVLDADDILQYTLFTDPNSPNTSIISSSNTPSFNFNPSTMATGITYYIAAIAGNGVNGNVDSSDPCWDISNIIEVIWWPEPTVAFASDSECLYANGSYDINIDFTGTPPFHLTGQVVLGGNVLTTFDNTYNFNSEVIVLYLPPTTPDGLLTIEALGLSDAHCTCN